MESGEDDLAEKPYLAALKKYWRSEPTTDDLKKLNVDLYGSPDRVVAILAGSLAERSLERLVRTALRTGARTDQLFDYPGPLSNFSSKIQFGYALKLFGDKTRHDLDLVREIRNAFAHTRKPIRFTTPAVRDVCTRLLIPDLSNVFLGFDSLDKSPKSKLATWENKHHPKTRYFTTCNEISKRIYWKRGGVGDEDLNELP